MEDKIFLPIDGVKFDDLFDWNNPTQTCQTVSVMVRFPGRELVGGRRPVVGIRQTGTLARCNEKEIALFRHGLDIFAVNEKCPHAGGPLHLGDLEELPDGSVCVRCPWHSWRFDVRSGDVINPKGRNSTIDVYPVQVKADGSLYIDEWTLIDAGEHFLSILENGDPIPILTTTKNIEMPSDADTIFTDDTFYASPHLFEQIYSLLQTAIDNRSRRRVSYPSGQQPTREIDHMTRRRRINLQART
ncbi:hypothetical protein ScPMuIL_015978 [Solemya velum]